MNKKNWDQKILNWATYPTGGYLAKTVDGQFSVTGFDRRETADYIFELLITVCYKWNEFNVKIYKRSTIAQKKSNIH